MWLFLHEDSRRVVTVRIVKIVLVIRRIDMIIRENSNNNMNTSLSFWKLFSLQTGSHNQVCVLLLWVGHQRVTLGTYSAYSR